MILFLYFLDLFVVYECFDHIYVFATYVCLVPWRAEQSIGFPGLELWTVVNLYVGAWNWIQIVLNNK